MVFWYKYAFTTSSISKNSSNQGYSAEKRVLYCKLGQFQKIREMNEGHLYQGLDQSTKGFLMFEILFRTSNV